MGNWELRVAINKAQSATAHLVSVLSKSEDKHAYREAKVAERALAWVAGRFASLKPDEDENPIVNCPHGQGLGNCIICLKAELAEVRATREIERELNDDQLREAERIIGERDAEISRLQEALHLATLADISSDEAQAIANAALLNPKGKS